MLPRALTTALVACALLPTSAAAATHTVAPGETLWGIAMANNLSANAVAAANGLSSQARVVAGTRLTIPLAGTTSAVPAVASGYTVRAGDSLSTIALRHGVSLAALAAANGQIGRANV